MKAILRHPMASALLLAPFVAAAQTYSFTALDSLGGTQSLATGINASGQIVGWTNSGANGQREAVLWSGTTATVLPGLGGNYSVANGINDAGQIVGSSSLDATGTITHAVLWNGTSPTDLGAPAGTNSFAYAINNTGQIAGYGSSRGTVDGQTILWNGTSPTVLPGLTPNAGSGGMAINGSGVVGGYSNSVAAVWWNGTPTALNPDGGSLSWVTGITDGGTAVGWSQSLNGSRALRWDLNGTTVLGDLGTAGSWANAVNSSGQVVGDSVPSTPSTHVDATLWNDTTPIDLNNVVVDMPSDFALVEATAINSQGQIVGWGVDSTDAMRAFLLTPITAPSPPTGVRARAGFHRVTLRWKAVDGATAYRIYAGTAAGGEGGTPVVATAANLAVVKPLTSGQRYYFVVTSVNKQGMESQRSVEVSAIPK